MGYHEMAEHFRISYQMAGHRIFRGWQDMARILTPDTLSRAESLWDDRYDDACDVTS